jgi:MFS transporter, DHA1 family, multidrug resistance protein
MGDAFLYAYLPANHDRIGISSFWMGIILSVNRFTRLFLNGRIAWLLNRNGIKTIIIIALSLSAFTTFSYGATSIIPIWIVARVIWGISFSSLRLGNTLYALHHPRKGTALGLSRAIAETGPVIALLTGPLLIQYTGPGFTFLSFGLLSLACIPLAQRLSIINNDEIPRKHFNLCLPSSYNILVTINAFISEGVLVIITGRLIMGTSMNPNELLLLTGALLGYRRLSLVIFSPLSGWLSDKCGFQKVFLYTTIVSVTGLLIIFSGGVIAGIITVFSSSAMNASAATGGAISPGKSFIKEASDNATWRDIGMATGTLAGSMLLSMDYMRVVIAVLIMIYVPGIIYYIKKGQSVRVTK